MALREPKIVDGIRYWLRYEDDSLAGPYAYWVSEQDEDQIIHLTDDELLALD